MGVCSCDSITAYPHCAEGLFTYPPTFFLSALLNYPALLSVTDICYQDLAAQIYIPKQVHFSLPYLKPPIPPPRPSHSPTLPPLPPLPLPHSPTPTPTLPPPYIPSHPLTPFPPPLNTQPSTPQVSTISHHPPPSPSIHQRSHQKKHLSLQTQTKYIHIINIYIRIRIRHLRILYLKGKVISLFYFNKHSSLSPLHFRAVTGEDSFPR